MTVASCRRRRDPKNISFIGLSAGHISAVRFWRVGQQEVDHTGKSPVLNFVYQWCLSLRWPMILQIAFLLRKFQALPLLHTCWFGFSSQPRSVDSLSWRRVWLHILGFVLKMVVLMSLSFTDGFSANFKMFLCRSYNIFVLFCTYVCVGCVGCCREDRLCLSLYPLAR